MFAYSQQLVIILLHCISLPQGHVGAAGKEGKQGMKGAKVRMKTAALAEYVDLIKSFGSVLLIMLSCLAFSLLSVGDNRNPRSSG